MGYLIYLIFFLVVIIFYIQEGDRYVIDDFIIDLPSLLNFDSFNNLSKEFAIKFNNNDNFYNFEDTTKFIQKLNNLLISNNIFNIEILSKLLEKNRMRKNLYSPGSHIPIVMEDEEKQIPDIYYVLAWNFKKEILPTLTRRLILPFYIPVITLICSLLLIKTNKKIFNVKSIFFYCFVCPQILKLY